MMHRGEKSDLSIVAAKPANGVGRPEPELVERREGAKENTGQASTRRTPSRASVSPWTGPCTDTSPLNIQGGSRMRECRTSGSVRGVPSNGHPYRNRGRLSRGCCGCAIAFLPPILHGPISRIYFGSLDNF